MEVSRAKGTLGRVRLWVPDAITSIPVTGISSYFNWRRLIEVTLTLDKEYRLVFFFDSEKKKERVPIRACNKFFFYINKPHLQYRLGLFGVEQRCLKEQMPLRASRRL